MLVYPENQRINKQIESSHNSKDSRILNYKNYINQLEVINKREKLGNNDNKKIKHLNLPNNVSEYRWQL